MLNINTKQPLNIQVEQVNSMFKLSSYLFIGLVLVIYVIADYYWDKVPNSIFYPWFIANIILVSFRIIMVKLFYKLKPYETITTWGNIYLATSIVSGFLWGYVALFMLNPDDVLGVVLIVTMMTGMVAGSMVPLSYFPPTHSLFTTLTLAPLAYVMFQSSNDVMITVGFVLIVYIFVMYAFSFIVTKSVTESIQLKFENLELLDNLRDQKSLAEKANVDKSRFLAATSHDLRQPLHALDLYLGALKNILYDQEQLKLLGKSQNSSQSLSQLLNALMDISNIDAGNIKSNIENFNLLPVLNDLMDEFYPVAETKQIHLHINAESVIVKSDVVLLGRIIRNLISNAINHNHDCEVELSIIKQQENITINISDSGKGMLPEELNNIFSEFYQLDNPERDRNKGLGLGLAIVRRISQILKHEISVKSELNKGSTFSITIPRSKETALSSPIELSEYSRTLIEGLFIVCIDDEVEVRDALKAILKSWGCEILAVDSAQNALIKFNEYPYSAPDIILSDYRLRENKTGVQAIKVIHEYFNKHIPAIIITGDTSKKIVERTKDFPTLIKPVDSKKLYTAMVKIISNT